jgi:hypothetical protein
LTRLPARQIENWKLYSMADKTQTNSTNNNGMQTLGSLLDRYKLEDKGGHISQEFQDFGYRMAMELGDQAHKSLYMRMAKKEDRQILEKALSFVKDANAKSPARLFMWKVKKLKEEVKLK